VRYEPHLLNRLPAEFARQIDPMHDSSRIHAVTASARIGWRVQLRSIVTAAALLFSITACAGEPRVQILDTRGNTRAVVHVEIADTAASRELGLMYRRQLAPYAGMLFIFKQPEHLTFWMKNTEIPLDMIFAAADGRVDGIVSNAEPFSEAELSVPADSEYVLEVNGGFASRHGIKQGDRLQFLGFTPVAKD
jgi:uncharacterized protein